MLNIHLANTDFEFELAHPPSSLSIKDEWARHPMCLQLQYLPLLYILSDEVIAVSATPPASFLKRLAEASWRQGQALPRFILLDSKDTLPSSQCLSWGASKRVAEWAKARHIHYLMPDWEVVQEINSKAFSFMHAPRLPDSMLLWNEEDLESWLKRGKKKRVLKTCFGFSGKGHYFIEPDASWTSIQKFCQKEWAQKRPLVAEPWVERVFDFSTQWIIAPSKEIRLIGSTVFETDPQGVYQATLLGDEMKLFGSYYPFLQEHQTQAKQLLGLVAQKGFFGHIGIDAFIYQCAEKGLCLHSVVELNGRKTMSLAALKFQQRWFPGQMLRFSFDKTVHANGLLPEWVEGGNRKKVCFKKQLSFQIL